MTDNVEVEIPAAYEKNERTGAVVFRWSDKVFTLRPPLMGDLRQLEELQEKAADAGRARAEAEKAAEEARARGETVETVPWTKRDQEAEMYEWWRLCFDLLSDRPLPPDDQCPPFLAELGATLIFDIRTHWITFPMPALGNALLLQALGAASNGSA